MLKYLIKNWIKMNTYVFLADANGYFLIIIKNITVGEFFFSFEHRN